MYEIAPMKYSFTMKNLTILKEHLLEVHYSFKTGQGRDFYSEYVHNKLISPY